MSSTPRYRSNADGSAVCQHRDLSVCPTCAAADDRLVDVVGAHFLIVDPAERAELLAQMAASDV
jgi:hypothetical protein